MNNSYIKRIGFQDEGIRIAFPLVAYVNICVYVRVNKEANLLFKDIESLYVSETSVRHCCTFDN